MPTDIDYRAVEVPSDKPPTEYTCEERRAEILALIEQAGHPRGINQYSLADRYGCTQPNISNDVSVLREFLADETDETTADAVSETVYQKAIRELVDDGEYMSAVRALESWNSWLFDRGKVSQEPDEHRHKHDATQSYVESVAELNAELQADPTPAPAASQALDDGGGETDADSESDADDSDERGDDDTEVEVEPVDDANLYIDG